MIQRLKMVPPVFAFWVLLSGSLEPAELLLGLVLSLIIGVWFAGLVWQDEKIPSLSLRQLGRLMAYFPYLMVEIVKASLHVAEKVLDPKMPIDPIVVDFDSKLQRPVSRVALANSITLTPGTLTIDVDETTYVIHCLGGEFRQGIVERTLESKVAKVFEEA